MLITLTGIDKKPFALQAEKVVGVEHDRKGSLIIVDGEDGKDRILHECCESVQEVVDLVNLALDRAGSAQQIKCDKAVTGRI